MTLYALSTRLFPEFVAYIQGQFQLYSHSISDSEASKTLQAAESKFICKLIFLLSGIRSFVLNVNCLMHLEAA